MNEYTCLYETRVQILRKVSTLCGYALYKRICAIVRTGVTRRRKAVTMVVEAFTCATPAAEDSTQSPLFTQSWTTQRCRLRELPEGLVVVYDARKDCALQQAGSILIYRLAAPAVFCRCCISDGCVRARLDLSALDYAPILRTAFRPYDLTCTSAIDINVFDLLR